MAEIIENAETLNVFYLALRTGGIQKLAECIENGRFLINGKIKDADQMEISPLMMAIESNTVPVINLLLDHGADMNENNSEPLRRAVFKESLPVVQQLISRNCQFNIKLNKGETMFDRVLGMWLIDRSWVRQMILKVILDAYCELPGNTEADIKLRQYYRWCKAVLQDDLNTVEKLIKDGIPAYFEHEDINVTNLPARILLGLPRNPMIELFFQDRREELFCAALETKNRRLVSRCLSAGVNAVPVGRRNLLQIAYRMGRYDVAETLKEQYDFKLEYRGFLGGTTVFFIRDPEQLTKFLEEHKFIDINAQNDDGWTALHNLVNCAAYEILLKYGADPTICCFKGKPPTHKCETPDCPVIRYFRKLIPVDEIYVNEVIKFAIEKDRYDQIQSPGNREVLQAELDKMNRSQIVMGPDSPGNKTLLDLIYANRDFSVYMSTLPSFTRSYIKSNRNFLTTYPHYGYILNLHHRRGNRRKDLIFSAHEAIIKIVGDVLEPELVEYILRQMCDRRIEKLINTLRK